MKKYIIYFIIGFVTLLATVFLTIGGICYINSNIISFIISTMISIFAGGFTSVLIAFLIEVETQKRRKKTAYKIIKLYVNPFVKHLLSYMELFCYHSETNDINIRSVKKRFYEWSEYYSDICKKEHTNDNDYFNKISIEEFKTAANLILSDLYKLNEHTPWLLNEEIMAEEITEINKIGNNFVEFKIYSPNMDYSIFIDNIKLFNEDLDEKLKKSEHFSKLSSESFSQDVSLLKRLKDN